MEPTMPDVLEFRADRIGFAFRINRPLEAHGKYPVHWIAVVERWLDRWAGRNRAVVNRPSTTSRLQPNVLTWDQYPAVVLIEGRAFSWAGVRIPADRSREDLATVIPTLRFGKFNNPHVKVVLPSPMTAAYV